MPSNDSTRTPLWATPSHQQWLDEQTRALLSFGENCMVEGRGAGWLTVQGTLDYTARIHTWITCRMAHVYSIGTLLNYAGAQHIAAQAITALRTTLHDDVNGGWYASIPARPNDGNADTTKSCYAHAFVVLAASSGVRANIPGSEELLTEALKILDRRFFEPTTGLHVDEWNADWSLLDPYRGLNANMHAVEALLAAGDVTGNNMWHDRALRIAQHVADRWAPDHNYRLPEHFDAAWLPLLDLNADKPDDQFKPFGATVGHGIEWARLLAHLDATYGTGTHPWLLDTATRLYERAAQDGWQPSSQGAYGLVYTTDWSGNPVVETRMHWVVAEAIAAAAALYTATGQANYAVDYEKWVRHAQDFFIDETHGSWHHELDVTNQPAAAVWHGKPDIYHAFQAMLIPRLPLQPTLASAVG